MDGYPLVQLQPARAVGRLDHLGVLVRRLGLVDDPALGDGPTGPARRDREQHSQREGGKERPAGQAEGRDESEREREDEEGPAGPRKRDPANSPSVCTRLVNPLRLRSAG